MLNRRELVKLGLYRGVAGALHLKRIDSGSLAWALDEVAAKRKKPPHKKGTAPFTTPMLIPAVKESVDSATLPAVPTLNGGIPTTYYETHAMQAPVNVLTIGNEATGQWLAIEALAKPDDIVQTALRFKTTLVVTGHPANSPVVSVSSRVQPNTH